MLPLTTLFSANGRARVQPSYARELPPTQKGQPKESRATGFCRIATATTCRNPSRTPHHLAATRRGVRSKARRVMVHLSGVSTIARILDGDFHPNPHIAGPWKMRRSGTASRRRIPSETWSMSYGERSASSQNLPTPATDP